MQSPLTNSGKGRRVRWASYSLEHFSETRFVELRHRSKCLATHLYKVKLIVCGFDTPLPVE